MEGPLFPSSSSTLVPGAEWWPCQSREWRAPDADGHLQTLGGRVGPEAEGAGPRTGGRKAGMKVSAPQIIYLFPSMSPLCFTREFLTLSGTPTQR